MLSSTSRAPTLSETPYCHFEDGLLRRWSPLVIDIDKDCGDYLTNLTSDGQVSPKQEKMIVSQARNMWTTSKAASFVVDGDSYETYARHGLSFPRNFMWDQKYGVFFQIRNREGGYSECEGWREEKRTHGNAFAIYALAALYRLTKDPLALDLEKEAFIWLEKHAYDPAYKGYFQFLRNTKTWWVQAKALNTLLIFSRIFPHDTGGWELFEKQWEYIDKYLLDHQKGDWYEGGGLDREPHFISGPKSHVWKCTYQMGKTSMNCIALLGDENEISPGIGKRKAELQNMIDHWKKT
jgi:mannose/cellobiose epimerase-like protein (N-acyl-D-glucosamine 2-epimerase family)